MLLINAALVGGALSLGRALYLRLVPDAPVAASPTGAVPSSSPSLPSPPDDVTHDLTEAAHYATLSGAGVAAVALGSLTAAPLVAVGLPFIAHGSLPLIQDALSASVARRRPSPALLTGLGVGAGFLSGHVLLAGVVTLGHHLLRAQGQRASDTLAEATAGFMARAEERVWLLRGGAELAVPLSEVKIGDTLAVAAGERVLLNAIVEEGRAQLGSEEAPEHVGPGDAVAAGTPLLSGQLRLRSVVSGASVHDAITLGVLQAQRSADDQARADGALGARQSAIPTALLTAGAWLSGGLSGALGVLAANAADVSGRARVIKAQQRGARLLNRGAVVRTASALSDLRGCDTVVIDVDGLAVLKGTELELASEALGAAPASRLTEERRAVEALSASGRVVVLLTRRPEAQAAAIANALGVTRWRAGLSQHEKRQTLRALGDEDVRSCFVGGASSDASLYRAAPRSIALGVSPAALLPADVWALDPSLGGVPALLSEAQEARFEGLAPATVSAVGALGVSLFGLGLDVGLLTQKLAQLSAVVGVEAAKPTLGPQNMHNASTTTTPERSLSVQPQESDT